MSDLLKWHEDFFSKCIIKEFDWIMERLKKFQQLNEWNVSY
jgi:hypothetical protein